MSFALCLRRSAPRLASLVVRVRSISRFSTVVNHQTLAAGDDWISSEQAVLGAINNELHGPVICNKKNPVDNFFSPLWKAIPTPFFNEAFPFEIEDIPGTPTVTFTREHNGEHIKIVATMPYYCPSNKSNNEDGHDDDDGSSNESNSDDDGSSNESNSDDDGSSSESNSDDDDGSSSESNSDDDGSSTKSNGGLTPISLVVTLTKKSGLSLVFNCMLCTGDHGKALAIHALYVNLPGHSSEDPKIIRGLDNYSDLNDDLTKRLKKYLEVRVFDGERPMNILDGYMRVRKVKEEYWLLINKVKEFLEDSKIDSGEGEGEGKGAEDA